MTLWIKSLAPQLSILPGVPGTSTMHNLTKIPSLYDGQHFAAVSLSPLSCLFTISLLINGASSSAEQTSVTEEWGNAGKLGQIALASCSIAACCPRRPVFIPTRLKGASFSSVERSHRALHVKTTSQTFFYLTI